MNCDEVQPYMNLFVQTLKEDNPRITEHEIEAQINDRFASWFKDHVENPTNNIEDSFLHDIAWGPKRRVKTWHRYFVNGYKFHTAKVALNKSTNNSGVCIKGTDYAQAEYDFYGIVQEIVELEYTGVPVKRVVLFKCDWFDPTSNRGTKVHPHYRIVEVHASRRYNKYDPFILAQQAMQVFHILPITVHEDEVNLPILDTPASEIHYEDVDMPVDNMEYEDDENQEEEEVEEEDIDDEEEDDGEEDTDDEGEAIYVDEDDGDDEDGDGDEDEDEDENI
ncbi:hypothetical protein K1719_040396 [Acacia pycnantha]|nr:hypothetical protein K1719_040396 [Acacia pycnantha]